MVKYLRIINAFVLISILAIFLVAIGGTLTRSAIAEDNIRNPHEILEGENSVMCTTCHRQPPKHVPERSTQTVLPNMDDFSIDPVAMCVPCHDDSVRSHPLWVKPNYPVPADLPLDKKGAVTCLTCHHTHGSLKSEHPCCSVSFMDRMLNSDRMTKSFLLRRENTKGQLCKVCHDNYR